MDQRDGFAADVPKVRQPPSHDPRALAVAVAYSQGMTAPHVVAKGKGFLADLILQRARAAGVYVHESKELVALLSQVDLDQAIPPELYQVIAQFLAWLHRLALTRADANSTPSN